MTAKEVIKKLTADGWLPLKGKATGHQHFKHPSKPGKVTVPMHNKDLGLSVLKWIERQAGIEL